MIEWRDPPEQSGRHNSDAEELRRNPGQWACLRSEPRDRKSALYGYASVIRTAGAHAWKPAGAFEARTVTIGETVELFARYVGPTESETP